MHRMTTANGFLDGARQRNEVFAFPQIPGSARVLEVYALPDDLPHVVSTTPRRCSSAPNDGAASSTASGRAQGEALEIHQERKWRGIRWWPFHRPQWRTWCLWAVDPRCEDVRVLDVAHAAVRDAAGALARPIVAS